MTTRNTLSLKRANVANPLQHPAEGFAATRQETSPPNSGGVADPHPAEEEHPHREARPGGANPPKGTTQRVNSHTHNGKAPPAPRNAENT